jgi:hypothetical protein
MNTWRHPCYIRNRTIFLFEIFNRKNLIKYYFHCLWNCTNFIYFIFINFFFLSSTFCKCILFHWVLNENKCMSTTLSIRTTVHEEIHRRENDMNTTVNTSWVKIFMNFQEYSGCYYSNSYELLLVFKEMYVKCILYRKWFTQNIWIFTWKSKAYLWRTYLVNRFILWTSILVMIDLYQNIYVWLYFFLLNKKDFPFILFIWLY